MMKQTSISVYIFLVIIVLILFVCACGTRYYVNGKAYDNLFDAERAHVEFHNQIVNSITPKNTHVGGKALFSMPDRLTVENFLKSHTMKIGDKDLFNYFVNTFFIYFDSIFKSIEKSNIFYAVDIVHSVNPINVNYEQYDFLIYMQPITDGFHYNIYLKTKGSEVHHPIAHIQTSNLQEYLKMLDSIESIARANYTPQKSPPSPTIATQTPAIITSDKRLALVIGNNDYQTAPLRNPVNDATDMANLLNMLGFEVILRTNADKRTMIEAIDVFGRKLPQADIGLLYFAGHGMQINGRNYLIPIQAQVSSETDVELESVDVYRVLGRMESAGNPTNIVILDACRDNPFARSFRTVSQGLAKIDAPAGSLIAFATSPGGVSADGTGRNGVFTKHLLQHMALPGLSLNQVLMGTRRAVAQETGRKQIPWDSSSLMADVYLIPMVEDKPNP